MQDSAKGVEPFRLKVVVRAGLAKIRLNGELDMANAPRLDEAFIALCSERVSATIIDASRVSFIDCTGLRSLLVIAEEMERHQGTMRVVNASAPVRRLLQLAGCDLLIEEPTGSPPGKDQRAHR
jgi:anti-sigma B factor antagonist